MIEQDLDTIVVYSTVSPIALEPNVLIKWGESSGIITATDVRRRAFALISAIAMATTEGGIFKTLVPPTLKSKGFGNAKLTADEKMAVGLLQLIRDARAPLPPDIEPIFGHNTHSPLIKYRWGNEEGTWELDTARHHAQALLEVAEAAETDSFLYKFSDKVGLEKKEMAFILAEFALFRQQNWLEDLL